MSSKKSVLFSGAAVGAIAAAAMLGFATPTFAQSSGVPGSKPSAGTGNSGSGMGGKRSMDKGSTSGSSKMNSESGMNNCSEHSSASSSKSASHSKSASKDKSASSGPAGIEDCGPSGKGPAGEASSTHKGSATKSGSSSRNH